MHARYGRRWRRVPLRSAYLGTLACLFACIPAHAASCPSLQFDGQVSGTESFTHTLDTGHTFLLERIASGWIVRVLPPNGPRPPHDYAELATPPYRSPNPLLISTDFAFRAQDAIAWNPRGFRFFATPAQLAAAAKAYEATLREPDRPSAGAALFPLIESACSAELRILDARIAGGTADQSAMAATVASHFAETAHTVETRVTPTPLGRIISMRFRVTVGAATK